MIVYQKKGEDSMNAWVIKPQGPYVTRKTLKRTPATEENRKRAEFLDSHEFSLKIENDTLIVSSSKKGE